MTNLTNRYLEAEVLTAPPQRLRLLLIEHAIRAGNATLAAWEEFRWEEGFEANIRCRELVAELLAGVDPSASELARNVADIYGFLLTSLAEASLDRDCAKLRDVLRVLNVERETWSQVCEQALSASNEAAAIFTPQIIAPPVAAGFDYSSDAGGFSVEA